MLRSVRLLPTDWAALALLLAACVYAFAKPIWDWDVIPYLALARHWTVADWEAVHGWVYGVVNGLPDPWKLDLQGRDAYRWAVMADSGALRQVSVFYQARAGYTLPLAGLVGMGIPAALAVQGLNLVGQVTLGGAVWAWLRRLEMTAWVALPVFAFFLFNPTVMKMARWSSPDGLVAASFVLGAYLLLHVRGRWWVAPWAAMVLLKPNMVVMLAPLGAWAWLMWSPAVLPLLGLGVLGAAMLWWLPTYPLSVLWQHTFTQTVPHPAELAPGWPQGFYAKVMLERLRGLHGRDLVVWAVMALSTVWVWAKAAPTRGFALAVLAGCVAQILVFPAFWERYFAGPAAVLALLAVSAACARRARAESL